MTNRFAFQYLNFLAVNGTAKPKIKNRHEKFSRDGSLQFMKPNNAKVRPRGYVTASVFYLSPGIIRFRFGSTSRKTFSTLRHQAPIIDRFFAIASFFYVLWPGIYIWGMLSITNQDIDIL